MTQPTQPSAAPLKCSTQQSRSEVVWRFTLRILHELRMTQETFAQNAVEHYLATVPLEARRTEFSVGGDPFRCATTNAQLLFRFENLTRHGLPLDLEEACLHAMPEPYQTDCRRELARRMGLLDVPLPDLSRGADVKSLAQVTCEYAGTLTSVSEVLADGQVTPEDAPHIDAAIPHIRALIGSCEGLLAQMEQRRQQFKS